VAYSFEAVETNEFSGRTMECSPDQLVPQGPGVDPAYQGCALPGSPPNSNSVPGADYLQTSFNYSRSNLWRNFGVVIAFSILYLVVTVVGTETLSFVKGGGGALVFKKNKRAKKAVKEETADEEKVVAGESSGNSSETATANEEEASSPGRTLSTLCHTKVVSAKS
jgi:ATP-binding cassette subfamily G (WHITE) protein 2 (SNQ2)